MHAITNEVPSLLPFFSQQPQKYTHQLLSKSGVEGENAISKLLKSNHIAINRYLLKKVE